MSDQAIVSAIKAHPRIDLDWLALHREDIVQPELEIVDPHHHLWDLPGNRYMFEDFLADIVSGHDVIATMHVQCRSMYRRDGPEELRPVGETEFVNSVAARSASGQYGKPRVCAGIIGTVDISLGNRVEAVLDAHVAVAGKRFKGIRPTIVWHGDADVIRVDTKPGKLLDDQSLKAVACIAQAGLCLDVWAFFTQLDDVIGLCRRFPILKVVVNHTGGPIGIGSHEGRREAEFPIWQEKIRALARCENVVMKLGGLGMRYAGFGLDKLERPASSDVLARLWRPYTDFCVQSFGPERCMFESNFPVEKSICEYAVLWNAFKKLSQQYSPSEQACLLGLTAIETYGIENSLARHPAQPSCSGKVPSKPNRRL
jgi:L-fuconolactonase